MLKMDPESRTKVYYSGYTVMMKEENVIIGMMRLIQNIILTTKVVNSNLVLLNQEHQELVNQTWNAWI